MLNPTPPKGAIDLYLGEIPKTPAKDGYKWVKFGETTPPHTPGTPKPPTHYFWAMVPVADSQRPVGGATMAGSSRRTTPAPTRPGGGSTLAQRRENRRTPVSQRLVEAGIQPTRLAALRAMRATRRKLEPRLRRSRNRYAR